MDCLKCVEGALLLIGTGVLGLELSGLPIPRLRFPYLLMKLSVLAPTCRPDARDAELVLCASSGVLACSNREGGRIE